MCAHMSRSWLDSLCLRSRPGGTFDAGVDPHDGIHTHLSRPAPVWWRAVHP